MKGNTFKFLLAILVIAGGLWLSIKKPTNLGLDLKGGVYVVLQAKPEEGETIDDEKMNRLKEVMERRINKIGVSEPVIQKAGQDRLVVEMAGVSNAEEAIKLIGKTALLEFKIQGEDGTLGETLLTGKDLKSASVTYGQTGLPEIAFELKTDGAVKFARITRENIGKNLAIVLDGEVQSAPVIRSEIAGGRGSISGNYTVESATAMATLLNAGALPVKAEIIETRTVGASLGEESINDSVQAAKVAVGLIAIFMILFYRLPGLVANFALMAFGAIAFGSLNYIDATLTLPGIAGFILSVGMAVDANVIIFERIKEELRFGNSIVASVDAGFGKAYSAIIDSNVTTLIITMILFTLGTGPVKGFAITLTIGILASMFSAIFITRLFLRSVVIGFKIKNTALFGVRRD